jgi:putative transposase
MKPLPQRKSPRLRDYNYSQSGAYFVTICIHQRLHLFGDIDNSIMHRSGLGEIAEQELRLLPHRWPQIEIDLFIIMPNHVHVIIVNFDAETVGTAFLPSANSSSKRPTLGHIIGSYKAGVTRIARQQRLIEVNQFIWQERFHDHIIRDEDGLNHIRNYVLHNPESWEQDTFYRNE